MATKNKTVETKASVDAYLKKIKDAKKRKDVSDLIQVYSKITKLPPKMWGPGIVGFGAYHYKYESGREGDAPLAALASRANAITLYVGKEFEKSKELLSKLGKHKMSGGCLHVAKLGDVDQKILSTVIKNSFAQAKKTHNTK
jgi:hypothetical protein